MTPALTIVTPPALDLQSRKLEIESAHDTAIENLITCGRLLADTQSQLDSQTFLSFCDDLKFSRSTAYNYMRLYQHSLVHSLDTLQNPLIKLSVWYRLDPDSDTVQKVKALADAGKKVTPALARQLVQETAPLNETLLKASETAPDFVADAITRGVITDIDGHDIPVHEADSTLIQVNTDQYLYESAQRQRLHIEHNSKPSGKLTVDLHLIKDSTGRFRLALPENVPAWLAGKQVTFYFSEDTQEKAA